MGASGIDVNSGSALDVLADSAGSAAEDADIIRQNAGREAQGYREEARSGRLNALNTRNEGRYAITAGQSNRQSILLNAAGSLATTAALASAYGSGSASKAGKAGKKV
jgi:hypothetical protein